MSTLRKTVLLFILVCPNFVLTPSTQAAPIGVVRRETTSVLASFDDGLTSIPAPELRRGRQGSMTLILHAPEVRLEIVAIPNHQLLAADARVIRGDRVLTVDEAGLQVPLKGYVRNHADSWVRLAANDGTYVGLIFADGNLYDLRRDPVDPTRVRFGKIDPTAFLHHASSSHYSCASEATAQHLAGAASTRPSTLSGIVDECSTIDITIVADYTHVQALGGEASASEAEMMTRMNEIDGIYRDDIMKGFRVKEVLSFPDVGGPDFNLENPPGEDYPSTPLNTFTAWKGEEYPNRGLAHLFTERAGGGGIVGLAWVGVTCQGEQATGVSNYLGENRNSTIVAAHEIGHNFGANHDSGSQGFIMHPSVDGSATQFSPESKSMIAASLGDCFLPCGEDDTETGSDTDTSSTEETSSEETTSEETTSEEQDSTSDETSSASDDDDDDDNDDDDDDDNDDDDDDDDDTSTASGDSTSSTSNETGDGDDDDDDASDTTSSTEADEDKSGGGCQLYAPNGRSGMAWIFSLVALIFPWRRHALNRQA